MATLIQCVPRKGFGSARSADSVKRDIYVDSEYSVTTAAIRTLFESHIVPYMENETIK